MNNGRKTENEILSKIVDWVKGDTDYVNKCTGRLSRRNLQYCTLAVLGSK